MHALFSKYLKGGKHPVKIVFPLGSCEPVEKTFADNQPQAHNYSNTTVNM